jgi:hypothetical protein
MTVLAIVGVIFLGFIALSAIAAIAAAVVPLLIVVAILALAVVTCDVQPRKEDIFKPDAVTHSLVSMTTESAVIDVTNNASQAIHEVHLDCAFIRECAIGRRESGLSGSRVPSGGKAFLEVPFTPPMPPLPSIKDLSCKLRFTAAERDARKR